MTPERDTLVFVEVKTRRNNVFQQPEEAVTPQKMRNLAIAANAYVKEEGLDMPLRFDIVAVTGTGNDDAEVNHIPNAFIPYF